MRQIILPSALLCFTLAAFTGSAPAQTFPCDHIHLSVPDPAAAANWYEKYFGGRRITEAPDRLDVRQHAASVPQEGGREAERRKRCRSHRLLLRQR